MVCLDGTSCDVKTKGWDCCRRHKGRAHCPANKPIMCSTKTCENDYCCDSLSGNCASKGGPRECTFPSTTQSFTTSQGVCDFLTSSGINNVMVCGDGSHCNVRARGWNCCHKHQGRAQCPANKPVMCANLSCRGDHCCAIDKQSCRRKGGPRVCS